LSVQKNFQEFSEKSDKSVGLDCLAIKLYLLDVECGIKKAPAEIVSCCLQDVFVL